MQDMTENSLSFAAFEEFDSKPEAKIQSINEIRRMRKIGWTYKIKKTKNRFHVEWFKKNRRLPKNGSETNGQIKKSKKTKAAKAYAYS